jgi:hypothetical protein
MGSALESAGIKLEKQLDSKWPYGYIAIQSMDF